MEFCEDLPGGAFDRKPCNENPCPEWSEYGPFSECSKICNSGTKFRNRTCSTGEDDDCISMVGGKSSMTVRCNTQACETEMDYWNNLWPTSMVSGFIEADISDGFFQGLDGETIDHKCATYCLSVKECFAMTTTYFDTLNGIDIHCFIFNENFFAEEGNSLKCWGSTCDSTADTTRVRKFGLIRDRHDADIENLPNDPPNGTFKLSYHEVDGLCGQNNNSAFGEVDFRRTFNYTFQADSEKNIIKDVQTETNDCAAECFNKAGCTAFFEIDNECNQVIGTVTKMIENDRVENSGLLTTFCPNSAFTTTFESRSDLYCLVKFDTLDEAEDYYNDYYYNYYYNTSTDFFNTWKFELPSGSPLQSQSQYVTLEWPTAEDLLNQTAPYEGYAWYKFIFDTNIRISQNSDSRKRRSTESILEELKQLENDALSYIMTNPILPADVTVLVTTPTENIYSRQIAMDGSVAADCSTGSCQCSRGFVDNGNGCVEILSEDSEIASDCNAFSFTCNLNDLEVNKGRKAKI